MIFCSACRNRPRQAPKNLELESATAEPKVTRGGVAGSRVEKWNLSCQADAFRRWASRKRELGVEVYGV